MDSLRCEGVQCRDHLKGYQEVETSEARVKSLFVEVIVKCERAFDFQSHHEGEAYAVD